MDKLNDIQPGSIYVPEFESRVVISPRDLDLIGLSQQKSLTGQVNLRTSRGELRQNIYGTSLEQLHHSAQFSWPFRYLRIDDASSACFVRPPEVFAIHCSGQPLPELCKEQVPPGIVLISINPEDFLEQSCFVAQPVPLEHLQTM